LETLLEKARAFLEGLEAEKQAALALSEEKAQEAKLIQSRQEGFRDAMELFGRGTSVAHIRPEPPANETIPGTQEPRKRRGRRPIRAVILREMAFTGEGMTAAQIARAIDYIPDRTEIALERMKKNGQVVRSQEGRWAIRDSISAHTQAEMAGANGKFPPESV
jgi:hypothetical protein